MTDEKRGDRTLKDGDIVVVDGSTYRVRVSDRLATLNLIQLGDDAGREYFGRVARQRLAEMEASKLSATKRKKKSGGKNA